MKIGLVGCGALGSFYGAKLWLAGHEVHFLLRSDYEVVRRRGIFIESSQGNLEVHPICARQPSEIGICDWVVIGLKTTANSAFSSLLPPLSGPRTSILTLQNGLGNEEQLAALFGPEPILGGLCFVCLHRVKPGVIHHLGHGHVVVGEYQRPAGARAQQMAACFQEAGVSAEVTDDLERAHWEKLLWNIPFNGLGVASASGYESTIAGEVDLRRKLQPCLTTEQLLNDPRWAALVREIMAEVVFAANALGFPVPASLAETQIQRTYEMGPYKASTVIDFERGQPLELESLFLLPLKRARDAGIATPRLENLCRVLQKLQRSST